MWQAATVTIHLHVPPLHFQLIKTKDDSVRTSSVPPAVTSVGQVVHLFQIVS